MVQNNKHHALEELFKGGMDVNFRDRHGNSALHIACQNGAETDQYSHPDAIWTRRPRARRRYTTASRIITEKIAAFLISKGANDLLVNEFGLTCYEGLKPPDLTI